MTRSPKSSSSARSTVSRVVASATRSNLASIPTVQAFDEWLRTRPRTRTLAEECDLLLGRVIATSGASRASLMLVNPFTARLAIRAGVNLPADVVGNDVPPRPHSISEWVFRQERGIVLDGEVSDTRFEGRGGIESAMSAPIVASDGPIGVINLARCAPGAPFNADELARLEALGPSLARALEQSLEAELALRAWRRMHCLAPGLVRTLVPPEPLDLRHYSVALARRSGWSFSGDLCERVSHANGSHTFLVTDVPGDGALALAAAGVVQGLFVSAAHPDRSAVALAARLSADLSLRVSSGAFAAAWIGTLSPNGQLSYCNAGYSPPLWVTAEGGEVHALTTGGPPLGAIAQPTYEEESLRLLPGDTIVVASDGVLMARDPAGRPFGADAIGEILSEYRRQTPERLAHRVLEAVTEYTGRPLPADDQLILAFRYCLEA
jgi:Stage II sporulation protein E (SpoIIE)/GAF domain